MVIFSEVKAQFKVLAKAEMIYSKHISIETTQKAPLSGGYGFVDFRVNSGIAPLILYIKLCNLYNYNAESLPNPKNTRMLYFAVNKS